MPETNTPKPSAETPVMYDEFGKPFNVPSDKLQQQYDENEDLKRLQAELEKEGVNRDEIEAQIAAVKKQIDQNAAADPTLLTEQLNEANTASHANLAAWDPRLARIDSFLMQNGQGTYVVPFSSVTAASSFMDLVFSAQAAVSKEFATKGGLTYTASDSGGASTEGSGMWDGVTHIQEYNSKEKKDWGTSIYVPLNHEKYEKNAAFYGTASLLNPYSITKLMGSLEGVTIDANKNVHIASNFIYDIRDQRRFYDTSNPTETSFHEITTPTIRNIIHWSNQDQWGRTPYQYQDFVYCKYAGIIPNNRLITLRRYHAPTYDNLSFEGMLDPTDNDPNRTKTKYFAPRCTLVTYFGGDSGNTLSDLLKFSTGIPWEDTESDIWDVSGTMGSDPQGQIDQMFQSGGFDGSENKYLGKIVETGNIVTGKILSFGKFLGAINNKFGMSDQAFKNISSANIDPYQSGSYANRIQGPINRIKSVKKRQAGIIFEQGFSIKFSYTAKSIGGINPKAAMLDILGNCMEMVSADALFWGGGHRFMIEPTLYPYHDGGWRDSFMKKLYDGKIFGKDGAMAAAVQGIKNFGTKDKDGKDTGDIWGNIQSHFGNFLGASISAIGSLITSAASALFGESSANSLQGIINKGIGAVSDNPEGAVAAGKAAMSNLLGNLNTMWRNKVLSETMVPKLNGMKSLLIGEPVGEWHLTVGNPLNPIIVVGNLVCDKMDVEFSDELGPDDFPVEMYVTYNLMHGMPRDKSAIQSMFNRGMGKFYELPDYIKGTSDMETKVDHYTGGTAFRQPKFGNSLQITMNQLAQNGYPKGMSTFQNVKVDPGSEPTNHGNPDTQLLTKFTPPRLADDADIVGNGARGVQSAMIPNIRSLGITRKYTN